MKDSEVAVVVLAAGRGSRMKSALPKVLHLSLIHISEPTRPY